jgi:peptide/nickel transport system substrate-binding protein
MNITLFDAAQMDFLFKKQFQSFFPEITDRGNPDFSYKHWHSSQMKNGFNVSSYMNPKVDRFLEEGRVSLDSDERRKAYFKYQKEIREDPPGIYLFWTNYLVGIHNRFRGVKISSLGPLSNVREWYVPKQEQKHSVQNE